MGSDHDEFNRLVALLDYPMFIVTTAAGDVRSGCLVGFATQASIHPPRFLVCLSVKNLTYRVAAEAEVLVVHLVQDGARELAELFGGETGDDTDKFARCQWTPGPGGAPVLSELENWFAGRIIGRSDFGDHSGFLLDPVQERAASSEGTLTFHDAQEIEPGHKP
ncbi:MAG TPA: flavin reductase family protein [Solirubrobacteraceae bacterium]|jgi:flavin reductase (DIM6/NTAB) family NADH-FMN oxidoreductase RutF